MNVWERIKRFWEAKWRWRVALFAILWALFPLKFVIDRIGLFGVQKTNITNDQWATGVFICFVLAWAITAAVKDGIFGFAKFTGVIAIAIGILLIAGATAPYADTTKPFFSGLLVLVYGFLPHILLPNK